MIVGDSRSSATTTEPVPSRPSNANGASWFGDAGDWVSEEPTWNPPVDVTTPSVRGISTSTIHPDCDTTSFEFLQHVVHLPTESPEFITMEDRE